MLSALGRHRSDETKRKISATLTGRPSTSCTKFKPGQEAHNRAAEDYTFIDSRTGYKMVRSSNRKNGWAREHTVIAERILGRRLVPGEEVHHVNGIKTDNQNNNLLICSSAYHRQLESLMATIYQLQYFGGRSHEQAVAEALANL